MVKAAAVTKFEAEGELLERLTFCTTKMSNHLFSYISSLPFPAEEVFAWYMRRGALSRLLPPWREVKLLHQKGSPDEEGAEVELQVRLMGLKWKWILQHRDQVLGKEFSDYQVKGPFADYHHRHRVEPIDPYSCRVVDDIVYRLPFRLSLPWIDREFQKLFRWRYELMRGDLSLLSRYQTNPLRILLTGSSGLVGKALFAFLGTAGHEVVRLVRTTESPSRHAISWDPVHGNFRKEDFEDFDAVIHLAGENIASGRWTKRKKESLFLSRCRDSWLLSQVLTRLYRPPKTVICASACGYYGNRGEEELTEESSRGKGFLADLCAKWEDAMQAIDSRGARVVHARFGAVLSGSGGMLQRLLLPFKLGLGGPLGSGSQVISWIGIDDAVGAIYHALMTESLQGPVNITAPHPVKQIDFATTLAHHLKRPSVMPAPAWVLRLIFGEMAEELLLSSAYVVPQKLLDTGYVFRYPDLAKALEYVT